MKCHSVLTAITVKSDLGGLAENKKGNREKVIVG